MKVAYIASFPPRECGIATFTQNLMRAISLNGEASHSKDSSIVIALNDNGKNYRYPKSVKFVIRQDEREDYVKAAEFINNSGTQTCVLQHEFGIFGGEDGIYILSLLHHLKIPFIVTFHTILKEPSYPQKMIIREIARKAAGVVVMSRKAVDFLDNIYEIPSKKIHLIEHGVPELPQKKFALRHDLLEPYKGRRILFTFGLLSRNKGIETVIRALPKVVFRHPEVVYLILGNTHPAVARASGEEYRHSLKQLVRDLKLQSHVRFIDRFVSETELAYYLSTIDIYITPYLNEAQITSGTLSYAVGSGAAVLSTPYWHAQELLSKGRGLLFGFKDSNQLAKNINWLLDNPLQMDSIKEKAAEYGKKNRWPLVGKKYYHLLGNILEENLLSPIKASIPATQNSLSSSLSFPDLPPFSLNHVIRLTDDTGIIQHAKYGIPNREEGYCLDDNARALILMLMAFRSHKSHDALKLLPIYLSFIHHMQRKDGLFHNFMSYKREYLDDIGSEDAFGRTIWALGYLIRYAPASAYRECGLEIFRKAIPHFTSLLHLRGIADTIIGITHYLACFPADEGMLQILSQLSHKLVEACRLNRFEDWKWFEEKMVYDNAILPLALLHSYEVTGNIMLKHTAIETFGFLENECFHKGYFSPVGNNGWYTHGKTMPVFDQQALETMAMVLAYDEFYRITGKQVWYHKMQKCHAWFLGENELHIPLYDQETKGCCDGLQENGVNRNQGAESTLAYWISHLTVMKAAEMEARLSLQQPLSRKEAIL